MSERVTIGVPVYKGERFLHETLDSIKAQTYRDLRVVISIDGPDPACEQICSRYLDDPRFELHVQPERLGLVGNINWCLKQVEDGCWYCHPQDDLTAPAYVETLLAHLRDHPSAAVAYCDIEPFGTWTGPLDPAPSVLGETAFTRMLVILHEHLPAFPFRGLTRAAAVKAAGPVPTNDVHDYGVDTAWCAGAARWGELHRVPGALYRKRYHDANTHSKWGALAREEKLRGWAAHCVNMVEQALQIPCSANEARVLFLAGLERLGSAHTARSFMGPETFSARDRRRLLRMFLYRLRRSTVLDVARKLDCGWRGVRRLADAGYWVPRERSVTIEKAGSHPMADGERMAVWVVAARHFPPGACIELAGKVLATALNGGVATAILPRTLAAEQAELAVRIVSGDGRPLSGRATVSIA